MRKLLILLPVFLLIHLQQAQAQRKLIKKFLSEKTDTTKKTSFVALPAAAYAQETGLEAGAISITSFYTEKNDTITRSSTINAIVTFTTRKQSNFSIKPDIWSPGNRYHYSAVIRYKNFPFDFYGVGDKTREVDKDPLGQKLFILTAEAERLVTKNIYAGLTAGFEDYRYSDKDAGGIYQTGAFNDREGGNVLYFGASVIYDSRNASTYTTRGSYLKLNYSFAPSRGSRPFTGSLIKADFRQFNGLSKKNVLGFNINFSSVQGNNIPFYLLPQLGNDQIMRGYYTGRYRDQNLLTAHTEWRYHFMNRFGVAAFAGAGTVFKNGHLDLNRFKPNYGAGARYFLDPGRGITLRMDYAVGEKPSGEKRLTGFYMALAEAF